MNYPIPIRPSWWYSLLAIPAALVGIGLFAYFLLTGIKGATATLTQVVVPGGVALNITNPGSYTIFLEQPSTVNGKTYSSTESVDALLCNMTEQLPSQTSTESPRTAVPLRRPSLNITYSLGNRPDDPFWNSALMNPVCIIFRARIRKEKRDRKRSSRLEPASAPELSERSCGAFGDLWSVSGSRQV